MKTDKVGKWGVIVIKFGWDKGWPRMSEWFIATNARMSEFYFGEGNGLLPRMHE